MFTTNPKQPLLILCGHLRTSIVLPFSLQIPLLLYLRDTSIHPLKYLLNLSSIPRNFTGSSIIPRLLGMLHPSLLQSSPPTLLLQSGRGASLHHALLKLLCSESEWLSIAALDLVLLALSYKPLSAC